MAVDTTLTPDDFTEPQGDLDPALFEVDDLNTYLQAWIDRAERRIDHEDEDYFDLEETDVGEIESPVRRRNAVRAYVYWKAWTKIYVRLSANPKSVNVEGASSQFSDQQISVFGRKAHDAKERFDALTSGEPDPDDAPQMRASTIQNARVSWGGG